MKQDDKNTAPTAETSTKKLRIKTSPTQPTPGPEFPCASFFF
jgi:hypothetical protein